MLWVLVATVIGPVVQELVRTLERRQEQQARLAARLEGVLTAATEHSIIATDVEGVITTFNQGAERMLGYSSGEIVGQVTPTLIHDPDEVVSRAAEMGIEPGFEVFVDAVREGRSETREWTYLAKDGTRVITASPTCGRSKAHGVLRRESGPLPPQQGTLRTCCSHRRSVAG